MMIETDTIFVFCPLSLLSDISVQPMCQLSSTSDIVSVVTYYIWKQEKERPMKVCL